MLLKEMMHMHVPAHNSNGCLPVCCHHSPDLRTTVIDERDSCKAAGHSHDDIKGTVTFKDHENNMFTHWAKHEQKQSLDVIIHGVANDGKCCTDPLVLPAPLTMANLRKCVG